MHFYYKSTMSVYEFPGPHSNALKGRMLYVPVFSLGKVGILGRLFRKDFPEIGSSVMGKKHANS